MSNTVEVVNGIIRKTFLGVEDHGIFVCTLTVETRSRTISFGGYILDGAPVKPDKDRVPTEFGFAYIMATLRALDVDSWEKVVGQYCRVELVGSRANRISHIVKDRWFDPDALARKYRPTPADAT